MGQKTKWPWPNPGRSPAEDRHIARTEGTGETNYELHLCEEE